MSKPLRLKSVIVMPCNVVSKNNRLYSRKVLHRAVSNMQRPTTIYGYWTGKEKHLGNITHTCTNFRATREGMTADIRIMDDGLKVLVTQGLVVFRAEGTGMLEKEENFDRVHDYKVECVRAVLKTQDAFAEKLLRTIGG